MTPEDHHQTASMHADLLDRTQADGHITLTTLGRASLDRIRADGSQVHLLEAGKPLALIAYLACADRRDTTRTHLMDLLWSHMERERAQNALRQTLWLIKERVGSHLLASSRDRVALSGPLDTDRDALIEAAQAGHVDEVVRLYTGDFFPDFADPGCDEFEEWITNERLRLRRTFVRMAGEQVQHLLSAGRMREALTIAKRVRDADRLRDAGWRLVIEAHLALGDSMGALVEVDALTELHASEGVDAEPATLALIQHARADANRATDRPPSAATALSADLVGREREFAAVMAAWNIARQGAGRPQHLRILAPPGLGKTRLLRDVQARFRTMGGGVRTVTASARHGSRDIPFVFVGEVTQKLCELRGARSVSTQTAATLVALNPALASQFDCVPDPSSGDDAIRRRTLAVRELLKAICDEQSLALLLDDLHWSDPASTRVIQAAVDGMESGSLLVLSAARPYPAVVPLSSSTILPLRPFGATDVHALLLSIASLPAATWGERLPNALCEAASGSPLLVMETLRLLIDGGLLVRATDEWRAPDASALLESLGRGGTLSQRVLQLSTDERTLLLLLSTAGVPLPEEILAVASDRAAITIRQTLVGLQLRGFVLENEGSWSGAHDEYTRALSETATAAELRWTALRIGVARLRQAEREARWRRWDWLHIGNMLAAGGDAATLARAFATFVRRARLDGETGSDRSLAREFVGASASDDASIALVRSLPMTVRARLVSPRRIAAAFLVAALAPATVLAVAGLLDRRVPKPDVVLLAGRYDSSSTRWQLFPLHAREAEWSAGDWNVNVRGRSTWRVSLLGTKVASLRPDGTGWLARATVPDSGVDDLYEIAFNDQKRRVTYTPGDDQDAAWSPDGRQFVFSSARWNQRDRLYLTKYDTLSRRFTQLSTVDGWDGSVAWSPDGSRLGFLRVLWKGGYAFCVVDADGQNERCRAPYRRAPSFLGWTDAAHGLMYVRDDSVPVLVRVAANPSPTDADSIVASDFRASGPITLSPDGRWILCDCEGPLLAARRWIVFPLVRPPAFRTLRVSSPDPVVFVWSPSSPRPPYLNAIRIATGIGPARVGSPYQLRATGTDAAGHRIDVVAARWRSLDTNLARIDTLGVVHPQAPGRARFEVTAGGWRTATATLDVVPSLTRRIFEETWQHGLDSAWVPFGSPRPLTVPQGENASAFYSNGDRYYYSGAYTKASFPARDGLWIEAMVSAPLTEIGGWQEQLVGLFSVTDPIRTREWDHINGDAPPGTHCTAYMPWGVGPNVKRQILMSTPAGDPVLPAPPVVPTGRWFSVVLQLFPDGRCGLAIDGQPLSVSAPGLFAQTVQVKLAGRSVETRILLGSLRVSEGVAPEVRWP